MLFGKTYLKPLRNHSSDRLRLVSESEELLPTQARATTHHIQYGNNSIPKLLQYVNSLLKYFATFQNIFSCLLVYDIRLFFGVAFGMLFDIELFRRSTVIRNCPSLGDPFSLLPINPVGWWGGGVRRCRFRGGRECITTLQNQKANHTKIPNFQKHKKTFQKLLTLQNTYGILLLQSHLRRLWKCE